MDQVIDCGRDPAKNAHDALEVEGIFESPRVSEKDTVVDHSHVIALQFRFDSTFLQNPRAVNHIRKTMDHDKLEKIVILAPAVNVNNRRA
jgi:hypothetical protein